MPEPSSGRRLPLLATALLLRFSLWRVSPGGVLPARAAWTPQRESRGGGGGANAANDAAGGLDAVGAREGGAPALDLPGGGRSSRPGHLAVSTKKRTSAAVAVGVGGHGEVDEAATSIPKHPHPPGGPRLLGGGGGVPLPGLGGAAAGKPPQRGATGQGIISKTTPRRSSAAAEPAPQTQEEDRLNRRPPQRGWWGKERMRPPKRLPSHDDAVGLAKAADGAHKEEKTDEQREEGRRARRSSRRLLHRLPALQQTGRTGQQQQQQQHKEELERAEPGVVAEHEQRAEAHHAADDDAEEELCLSDRLDDCTTYPRGGGSPNPTDPSLLPGEERPVISSTDLLGGTDDDGKLDKDGRETQQQRLRQSSGQHFHPVLTVARPEGGEREEEVGLAPAAAQKEEAPAEHELELADDDVSTLAAPDLPRGHEGETQQARARAREEDYVVAGATSEDPRREERPRLVMAGDEKERPLPDEEEKKGEDAQQTGRELEKSGHTQEEVPVADDDDDDGVPVPPLPGDQDEEGEGKEMRRKTKTKQRRLRIAKEMGADFDLGRWQTMLRAELEKRLPDPGLGPERKKAVVTAFDLDDVRRCCCKKDTTPAECHVASASKKGELRSSSKPWTWNKWVCQKGYRGNSKGCGPEWEWLEVYDREGGMERLKEHTGLIGRSPERGWQIWKEAIKDFCHGVLSKGYVFDELKESRLVIIVSTYTTEEDSEQTTLLPTAMLLAEPTSKRGWGLSPGPAKYVSTLCNRAAGKKGRRQGTEVKGLGGELLAALELQAFKSKQEVQLDALSSVLGYYKKKGYAFVKEEKCCACDSRSALSQQRPASSQEEKEKCRRCAQQKDDGDEAFDSMKFARTHEFYQWLVRKGFGVECEKPTKGGNEDWREKRHACLKNIYRCQSCGDGGWTMRKCPSAVR